MGNELDKFITSQARLNTLAKNQSKSINILNLQYRLLNKVMGPFYTTYVDLKNAVETAGEVFDGTIKRTKKLGETFSKALKPISGMLKVFQQINPLEHKNRCKTNSVSTNQQTGTPKQLQNK